MEKYSSDRQFVVMTRDEARAFDSWAINTIGVPGVVLMENAGRSCAELIEEKLEHDSNAKVCIVCGTGNNGGDGYVIARHLRNSGCRPVVVILGDEGKIKGDAATNLAILKALHQVIKHVDPHSPDATQQIREFASDAEMVVDGIFGTGLSGEVKGGYKQIIEAINAMEKAVFAIDIPSGLDCDTGLPLGIAIKADYTVTFGALKKGFTVREAQQFTGEIYIASIGINPDKK